MRVVALFFIYTFLMFFVIFNENEQKLAKQYVNSIFQYKRIFYNCINL